MRVDGEWFECDDGILRPVLRGEILAVGGFWEPSLFLVDTEADRTVFSAAVLDVLGLEASASRDRLGGVGGVANSVDLVTRVRFPLVGGENLVFRGEYAAFTELESLDMCVLGRDVLDMFAVIIDRSRNLVAMVRERHQYRIEHI